MAHTLNNLRILLIAAWLGAAIFFSATVAPSAFGVLRSSNVPNAGEVAGSIVNRTLAVVNTSGFCISLFALALAFPLRRLYGPRTFVIQIMLLGLISLATGIGQWVIAAKMRVLREAMGAPIDSIAMTDPNRVAFATLHGYSVATLSVAIIAGLIVFFILNNRVESGRN
ncbi:MAG TPA: DUF4149 domain-containing protein [Pyrinomonadaceae bacterium]|nr:DUF4149 domain-containing protein [Pyrinomonadaceae bacterium]